MNWVLIGVLIILGLYAFSGFKKGMVKIILSLVAIVVTIFITMALTPVVGGYIQNNTEMYSNLKKATYEGMQKNNTVGKAFVEIGETQGVIDENQSASSYSKVTDQVIDTLPIPDSLKKQLQSKIDVEEFVAEGMTSVQDMVAKVLAEQIASIIFNIIIFIVIFVLVYIIMQVVIKVVDVISMLPVLKQFNKVGGLALGLLKGLIVVWVFFMVMTMFCDTQFGQTVFANINDNSFLAFLYNNNLILKLIFAIV